MTTLTRPALHARGLHKSYPGVVALDDVTVQFRVGEVVGLIGQNGAGKSSLLKVLSGVIPPDRGELLIAGCPTRLRSVVDAAGHGIGMVFQEQSLVSNLTISENIFLGRDTAGTSRGLIRWRRLHVDARPHLEKVGLDIDPATVVSELSFAQRQLVELAKVLAIEETTAGPITVLFDEPTSVLSGEEIDRLFAQIRRLADRAAIVFVSHRLEEVLEISDRAYVLRDGRVVADRSCAGCSRDELVHLMVGQSQREHFPRRVASSPTTQAPARLVARGLSGDGFRDVSFRLPPGHILGIAGVVGSGRSQLARAIFGLEEITSGSLAIDGRPYQPRSPLDAIGRGVGLVPAERKQEGMISGLSVHDNILIAAASAAGALQIAGRAAEQRTVRHWVDTLGVRTPTPGTVVDALSGGNQQKVVLGKWLALEGLRVLILDHPTRGLDIKAKQDVYRIMRQYADQGLSFLLLSDTLDELLGMSDDILVMRDGNVTATHTDVRTAPPTGDTLIRDMV